LGFLRFAREEGRKNSASILKYFEQAPQPLASMFVTVVGVSLRVEYLLKTDWFRSWVVNTQLDHLK